MTEKEFLTLEGRKKIEAELNHLIKGEREDLKVIIAEARALGDLKENAEYHSAKEKQSHIEGRIAQLQGVLSRAEIIDVGNLSGSKVVFGATITLFDIEKEVESLLQIVGKEEADSKIGKISYASPLGKALLGKEKGDTVIVMAPKGKIEYEILSINFKVMK